MRKMRKLSLLLAASVAASAVPAFQTAQAAAADVVLKGRYETNIPVKVEYEASGDVSIQWEVSDSGTDGWTAIDGATSASYTPDQGKGLKWIRAGVTSGGETVYSAPKQLKDRWYGKKTGPANGSTGSLGDNTGPTYTMNISNIKSDPDVSDPDTIFTIDGDEYLLLDVTEDDNSHFLVMRRKAVGNHTVSTGAQQMDDLMCWLNDRATIEVFANGQSKGTFPKPSEDVVREDYTGRGYRADMQSAEPQYYGISDKIMKYVDENAVWKQEPRMWEWGNTEITYSGGLTIPSMTDYERYIDKIGWKDFMDSGDENVSTYMAFRTGHGSGCNGHETATYTTDWPVGQTYGNDGTKNAYAIRPMFFLKHNFFLDADIAGQINFDEIGEDVKAAIANSAPMSELTAAGYDEEKLAPYVNKTGAISEITPDGIYEPSMTIDLHVDYEGTMANLVYSVYVSDTESGEYTIAGAQKGNNLVQIPVTAAGKYVKFSVTTTDGIVKWTEPHYVDAELWGRDGGIHPEQIGSEKPTSTPGETVIMKDLAVKNETTPKDYIFTVGGMDFIMLDTTESDKSKFFVMSKNVVTGEPITFEDAGQTMDKMMDFLNSTNGVKGYMPRGDYQGRVDENKENIDILLPDQIVENINFNQSWRVEQKMYTDNYERMVVGGISFPAMHEIREYSEKIGLWDDKVEWWTRTPLGTKTAGGDTTLYADEEHLGAFFAPVTRVGHKAHLRPVFYLDKSMFTDEVYDFSEFGAEVIAAIRKAYTRDELAAAGYSEETLQKYYDVDGELLSAEINGIYETSLPVSAKFDYTGNNLENIRISWYQADTGNGDYKLIGTVSGKDNDFRIPYSAGGKYIKAEVTCIPTGTSFETEARYVEPEWGPQLAINNETPKSENGVFTYEGNGMTETFPDNSVFGRVPQTTPAEYTFTYNGVEYILLDTTESDESHYLVVTKTPTVKRAFNEKSSGQTFDDFIGWLNNLDVVTSYVEGKEATTVTGYSTNGFLSSKPIPEEMKKHINWDNNWKVERKMWDDTHERVYVGGIAIPSYKDFERYAEKMGVYDAGNANTWLRTPDGKRIGGDGNVLLATGTANEFAGYFYGMNLSSQNFVRPMFYLDKDFFTTLRVENIGSETAALIREDVPKEDMIASGLYSDAEIEEIYKVVIPPEEDYVRAEFVNLSEGGDVVANIKTNIPGENQWVFIAAVYSADGRLLGVNYDTQFVQLNENNVYELSVTVSNIPAGSGNYAKVFVWDNVINDEYPLFPAIVSE